VETQHPGAGAANIRIYRTIDGWPRGFTVDECIFAAAVRSNGAPALLGLRLRNNPNKVRMMTGELLPTLRVGACAAFFLISAAAAHPEYNPILGHPVSIGPEASCGPSHAFC